MSERTVKVYDCDLCGTEGLSEATELAVQIDRRADTAGSMENWYGVVWVCYPCLTRLLKLQLKELGFSGAQEWLKQFHHWERR